MKTLTIISGSNEDWNGSWKKDDVERETRELGYPAADWIEWVLDHVFSEKGDPPAAAVRELLDWATEGRKYAGSVELWHGHPVKISLG